MNSNWRTIFRKKFCPDVQILKKNTVAWMEANKEPFNHRRRCEINSGTVVGTSVEALALLTYFKLRSVGKYATSGVKSQQNLHPALLFLGNDLEAQDTILGKVHVSLKGSVQSGSSPGQVGRVVSSYL